MDLLQQLSRKCWSVFLYRDTWVGNPILKIGSTTNCAKKVAASRDGLAHCSVRRKSLYQVYIKASMNGFSKGRQVCFSYFVLVVRRYR